jgi:hypothetical protein
MSDILLTDLGERERLLIMANYRHGPPPNEESSLYCWGVLAQAMHWAGVLTDARTLTDQIHPESAAEMGHLSIEEWTINATECQM